jgi:hypothetical protein
MAVGERFVDGGWWLTLLVVGGWWLVVGGRRWTAVDGGGRWWMVVDGGGRMTVNHGDEDYCINELIQGR